MFIKKNKLFETLTQKKIIINLSELKKKLNVYDDFFIIKEGKKIKIYDRVCDHAGGKLISKDNKIICPIHNWEFCIKNKKYKNGFNKKELKFNIHKNKIEFDITNNIPKINQYEIEKTQNLNLKFINHACVKFEHEKFSFATDPWCFGPAFNNGWWLKNNSRENWIEELDNCDFIYISHNHPDHLHKLSLKKIDKSKKIIIPKFNSDSTGLLLEDMGFKNIDRLEFNHEYKMKNSPLNISLLKSGDFREDSGLYFSVGKFTSLMDVDANSINFSRLPNVTMYASSFSGGASGYPLMFDNFLKDEIKKIILKNRNFILSKKKSNMSKIRPKYFFPYASYFTEILERDSAIKEMNKKNDIIHYKNFCDENKITILNTQENDEFSFKNETLKKETKSKIKPYKDGNPHEYLKNFKLNYFNINDNYIKNYFENSKFYEKLELYLSLTNDKFESNNNSYYIDFSKKKILLKKFSKKTLETKYYTNSKNNKLYLKVRQESFLSTIYNKHPWEDMLIGFSCKVLRKPNIYNAKFWHHFTNIYVSEKRVGAKLECNNCVSVIQEIDKEIFKRETINNL